MAQTEVMQLVDMYASACVELESENSNYGTVDGSSVSYVDRARATLVAEIEELTKDSIRYQFLKNAKALTLKSDGATWKRNNLAFISTHSMSAYGTSYGAYESLDELVDSAIASQNDRVVNEQ